MFKLVIKVRNHQLVMSTSLASGLVIIANGLKKHRADRHREKTKIAMRWAPNHKKEAPEYRSGTRGRGIRAVSQPRK
jgi:hypothetical protein